VENTINQVFRNRARKYQDRLAIEKKRDGQWETTSWNQYYERARAAGLAFGSLGAEKGDRIALLSENRLEWLYTDMGAMGIGCCVVPIYATLTADEVAYIIKHEFSQDTGELTPSLKLKRKVVQERHRDEIDSMYNG